MAYSSIEDKYLSALTAVQFPDEPPAPVMPEQTGAMGTMPGDIQLAEAGSRGLPQSAYSGQTLDTFTAPNYDKLKKGQFRQDTPEMRDQSANAPIAALRGWMAGTAGFPGDIEHIVRLLIKNVQPDSYVGRNLQPESFLPTSEFYKEWLPLESSRKGPVGEFATDAGSMLGGLGTESIAKGIVKTGKALAPKAGEMAANIMERGGVPIRGLNIVESSPDLAIDRVPGVKPGDELIVQHNLTAANLLKADKLGGLPVPSLAISKVGSPLENFGEITLIAPKNMANPSAVNPVFRSDAYTPRFPVIDFQFDSKSSKNLDKMFADTLAKIPDGKSEIATVKDEWKDKAYSRVLKAKFLDEQGLLPDSVDFKDRYDFYAAVQTKVNEMKSEYADWVDEFDGKLADAGVTVKERIFKGYTYSGDRRYAAATLDNIVKEMKGGAGGENFNYGVGNLRAVATPKFRTLNQIKASRENISNVESMKTIKDQSQEAYIDLLNRMREVNKNYSAEDALLELAQSKRMSTLDRIYENKLPNDLKADLSIFMNKIQELPTEYFEMKPQRAVSLEEFNGAIIPKDTPKAAREVLKKAGITDVYEYSTPQERKGLFDKFGKEMFTTMPAAPIGVATMQDKEQK